MEENREIVHFPSADSKHKVHLLVRIPQRNAYYGYRMYQGDEVWFSNTTNLQYRFPLCQCRSRMFKTFERDNVVYHCRREHSEACPFLKTVRLKDPKATVFDHALDRALLKGAKLAHKKIEEKDFTIKK